MVCVGIDVAKDKHDCFILNSEGTVLCDVFTIPNNADGFKTLLQKAKGCTTDSDKIKVGLEATGHYSYNILGFLLNNDLPVFVLMPLCEAPHNGICLNVGYYVMSGIVWANSLESSGK